MMIMSYHLEFISKHSHFCAITVKGNSVYLIAIYRLLNLETSLYYSPFKIKIRWGKNHNDYKKQVFLIVWVVHLFAFILFLIYLIGTISKQAGLNTHKSVQRCFTQNINLFTLELASYWAGFSSNPIECQSSQL